MNIKTTAIILALAATAAGARVNTRQAWSGLLRQKSMDEQGQTLSSTTTLTAGLVHLKDIFAHASYNPPDPKSGMEPLPDDIWAYGYILMWWDHGGEGDRMAIRWERTFAGKYSQKEIPQDEFGMDPVGISYFSGLMTTENGRNKTVGGFALEVENRAPETATATVTTDWLANEQLPAHRTTSGTRVPAGSLRVIPAVPEKDEWALADGSPIEEVW